MDVAQILARNRAWAAEQVAADPDFFIRHLSGQRPSLLYLGCSDSRVAPEQTMGMGPGEVLVHRNVANIVSASDPSVRAVVAFAVGRLGIDHVIVCGHYRCGGVAGAAEPRLGDPHLDSWLEPIRRLRRHHAPELDTLDEQEGLDRLVELNVKAQCRSLLGFDEVAGAVARGDLWVHCWVYDLGAGRLIDLGSDEASPRG